MSIRSELKANWQERYGKPLTDEERKNLIEAKRMIEEFMIPMFRKIAEYQPYQQKFSILFIVTSEKSYYRSSFDSWKERKVSPYPEPVILQAMKIAKNYAIDTEEKDFGLGEVYKFELDIS